MRLPPRCYLYNFNVPAPQSIAEATEIGVRTDKATISQHYGYARYDYGMHLLKDPSVVRPEMLNDARFGWKKGKPYHYDNFPISRSLGSSSTSHTWVSFGSRTTPLPVKEGKSASHRPSFKIFSSLVAMRFCIPNRGRANRKRNEGRGAIKDGGAQPRLRPMLQELGAVKDYEFL